MSESINTNMLTSTTEATFPNLNEQNFCSNEPALNARIMWMKCLEQQNAEALQKISPFSK